MLYILDYGAGNVASLANSVRSLGYEFKWVESVEDIEKADRILFPGVGSFQSAMASLRTKGFAEPLKQYIESGRPYMGICIGMQALFTSSLESPTESGLSVIPAKVGKFDSSSKSVPCMGWNGTTELKQGAKRVFGFGEDSSLYFVHSYRVEWQEGSALEDWALTLTKYGEEIYVSSVQKGNVFATQFHPEKSGQAGLNVLKAWLDQGENNVVDTSSTRARRPFPEIEADLNRNGFTKRIVACLDVRANDSGDLVVTKGDQYDVRESETSLTTADAKLSLSSADGPNSSDLAPPVAKTSREVRNLGKPVDLARRYFDEGADEICFLNITAFRNTPLHDQPMLDVVRNAAETVFVPLTIGGGIKDTIDPDGTSRSALEVAGTYFRCGADKVSIGSDAVFAVEELLAAKGEKTGKSGVEQISYGYGNQAVVVSIDPKRVYANSLEEVNSVHLPSIVDLASTEPLPGTNIPLEKDLGPNGERYCWYQCTVSGGRISRDLDVVQLAQGVEILGAGEILLNSVDRDGSKRGFDLRLVNLVKKSVTIPVVASSGAGKVQDFSQVFQATQVEAALAAGIFHRKEVPIEEVKKHLGAEKVQIRKL